MSNSSAQQILLHHYCIGLKLKALRLEKRLTLSRLAAETGYSTALLSKLETDRMIPTLPTLAGISHAYGVDLSYFFSAPEHHSLAITRKAHLEDHREQPAVKQTALHVPTAQGRQVSKIVDIPAGITWNLRECGVPTEFTAYVLEGQLRVSVAGTDDVLHTGDCLVLNTQETVVWNAPKSRCRVLAVFAK